MAEAEVFRIGETRRIAAKLKLAAPFRVTSVAAYIYNSAGTATISGGAGDVDAAQSRAEHEFWYAWTPATADDYTYQLEATTDAGGQVFASTGAVYVLSRSSKYDRWVERVRQWLRSTVAVETPAFPQVREALDTALEEFSRARPLLKTEDKALTTGTWEYVLPSDYLNGFSGILRLAYPFDSTLQSYPYLDYGRSWEVDEARGKWLFTGHSPTTGQTARIHYQARYTLNDSTDNVPADAFHAVAQLAAAFVLMTLANESAGSANASIGADFVRTKAQEYQSQARAMMAEARRAFGRRAPWVA